MEARKLNGKVCYITGVRKNYEKIFLWPVGKQEEKRIERMFEKLSPVLKEHNCLLAAFEVEDWNGELSPWKAPAVFGKEGFSGQGGKTLQWLVQDCISHFQKISHRKEEEAVFLIGGYSLAGLFALWAFHETGLFRGAASCSGSLWYPGFVEYIEEKEHPEESDGKQAFIYLSLGVKEEKNKNPILSTIRERTEKLYDYYGTRADIRAKLEWNPGNHFTEPEGRLYKGFCRLLENTD